MTQCAPSGEDEYLLGKGSNWYVSGVCRANGRYFYLLDELPPTAKDPRVQNGAAPRQYTFDELVKLARKLGGDLK